MRTQWVFSLSLVFFAAARVEARPATADQILFGFRAYDQTGHLLTGTMPDRGAVNGATGLPGPGFYHGAVTGLLQPSEIVKGVSILGVAGTAGGSFGDLMTSLAFRDLGASTLSLSAEVNQGSCSIAAPTRLACDLGGGAWTPGALPAQYRILPDAVRDNEGFLGGNIHYANRPSVDCGSSGAVLARVMDCASKNPNSSSWNGASAGNGGQSSWRLVSRTGANNEVWQDQRTGLLWSSLVGRGINWCQAAGVTTPPPVAWLQAYNGAAGTAIKGNGTLTGLVGGSGSAWENGSITFSSATTVSLSSVALAGETAACATGGNWTGALTLVPGSTTTYNNPGVCSFTIHQGSTPFAPGDTIVFASTPGRASCVPGAASALQLTPAVSYCAESPGLAPPTGESWSNGGYSAAKGGMGANTQDKVLWRLPSRQDFNLAEIDGIRMVMPDLGAPGSLRALLQDSTPGVPGQGGSYVSSEWTSTVYSVFRNYAWVYSGSSPWTTHYSRDMKLNARCVGR